MGGEEKIDGHAWFSTESPEVSLRGFLAPMGGGGGNSEGLDGV